MNINYWHIQLHPDDSSFSPELIIKILEEKSVIGLGEWEKGEDQITQFKEKMAIGDIVAVKQGSTPIALVKVIGDAYFEEEVEADFDWFPNRRKIEIIDLYNATYNFTIPQPRGTLSICTNLNTETAKVIIQWHRNAANKRLMENINLSIERPNQIKDLWRKYKSEAKKDEKFNTNEIESLITQWNKYKDKITNGTLTLDEYTNRLGAPTATMPGGYLCNFLERTTRTVLGSSKPGSALNFEVKLNDNNTYHIKSQAQTNNATRKEAEDYFSKNIKGLLKDIVSETDPLAKIILVEKADYSAKQILMKMAVLDNLSDFLYIYSTQWLEELYSDFIDGDEEGIFTKNHQVCLVAKELLQVNDKDNGELILLSRFLWRYVNAKTIADANNPNVIMYGPPGTGKTYSVVNSLDFVCQGDSSRYELLQFHPSFTYEDFIEGIKPKGVSEDGNIRFELVNGAFKNFCIKAKNNPSKAYYFVVDEINRANLSSVFGETLSLLEKDYRHDGTSNKNLIKTQYSSLIEDLIREDDEYKKLAYIIDDNGEVKFGVPENVFFIGMMNDVDKSIDAFDLALRRRFKWIRKDCDLDVIREETRFKGREDFNNIDDYVNACEKLNNFISGVDKSSNSLGLGKSYEFGHSFFMKMSDIAKRKVITEDNLKVLFNLYLQPTLKEYLRAVFSESELDDKINEALNHFKETIK
jgi:5-methylcytosine-specific restriction enzyme B